MRRKWSWLSSNPHLRLNWRKLFIHTKGHIFFWEFGGNLIPINSEEDIALAVIDYLADPGSEQLLDIEFKEDGNGSNRINAIRFIIQASKH